MENRIKVVLADANENFRTMLQQTIENTGEFDVVGSAGDGAEAWKMIERERPQLVITDVILPELDGFALLDRMAKLPARPKTILVSAFYREQMVMQAMEQGAAYFMAKPCEAGSLLERMRQAVRNGETEEESPLCREILAVGLPPFFMNACACLVVIIINRSLNHYGGDLAIGAYGILNRLVMLFGMVVMGLTQGMQPIIGYNFGAGRPDRVRRTLRMGMAAGAAITSLGWLAFQFAPEPLARMFTDHADLLALSVHALRACSAAFFIVGWQIVVSAYFQAIGLVAVASFLSLSRQMLFLIPCLLLLPRWFGLDGVWYSLPAADMAATVVTAVILCRVEMRRKV